MATLRRHQPLDFRRALTPMTSEAAADLAPWRIAFSGIQPFATHRSPEGLSLQIAVDGARNSEFSWTAAQASGHRSCARVWRYHLERDRRRLD